MEGVVTDSPLLAHHPPQKDPLKTEDGYQEPIDGR